jgi:hypothetical protein
MDTGLQILPLDVKLSDEEDNTVEQINDCLSRLASRKKSEIRALDDLQPWPPAAWYVAVYWQAVLYRLVAAAQGTIIAWNAGNVLCSFLAARALFETVTIIWDYHRVIAEAFADDNLENILAITVKAMMASRDPEYLAVDPEMKATNIITTIDRFDKAFKDGPLFRRAYDTMSERCHPNSQGTFQMYAKVEPDNMAVKYLDRQNSDGNFQLILFSLQLILAVEYIADKMDRLISDIRELERRHYSDE